VVVGIAYVSDEHELMLITQQGQTLRMGARDVRVIGRATQGVRLIGVAEGDRVVSIVRLEDQGDANGGEPNGTAAKRLGVERRARDRSRAWDNRHGSGDGEPRVLRLVAEA
jgi:DNA gyrase/topoisomerase IV subunit A